MRIFFDTNVLISYIARGLCSDLIELVVEEHHPLISPVVVEEFESNLREKFDATEELVRYALSNLKFFEMVNKFGDVKSMKVRDPNDIPILAAAIGGGADVLVTGDKDLLDLASKSKLLILNPRQLWELLQIPK